MWMKSGLFLCLLAVLQVSARYKNVVPELEEDTIELEPALPSSSRIISGWEAQLGQLPYHAAIRMVSAAGTIGRCGGAIVSRRWVLTAAQCTAGRVNLIVRVGVVSISDNNPENIFETTEWYNFPSFDDSRPTHVQPNDIALVRLQRPVAYSELVQPIRVQSGLDAYRNYDGERVIVSGHGRISNSVPVSDVLRWVYLRAISNNECAKAFPTGTIVSTIVCAQYFSTTAQSACPGDYGGPLVHNGSDGNPTLIGIFVFTTSEGTNCPRGLPTGYTRPAPYLPWFQDITGLNFEDLQDDDDKEAEVTTTPASSTYSTTTPSTSTASTTTLSTSATFTTTAVNSSTTPSITTTTPFTPTTSNTTTTTSNSTISTTTTKFIPDESTTAPPEENEEDTEDSDNLESNDKDDMGQLLKRLQVDVRVKVRFDKYNVTKVAENEISVAKH